MVWCGDVLCCDVLNAGSCVVAVQAVEGGGGDGGNVRVGVLQLVLQIGMAW